MYLISKYEKKKKKELTSHPLQDILFLESKIMENLFNSPISRVQRLKPACMMQSFPQMHLVCYNCPILTFSKMNNNG